MNGNPLPEVDQSAPVSFAPLKLEGGKRSNSWATVRRAWLLANSQCEACGGREQLEVHHERPFHLWPELELSEKNFVTLCEHPSRQCHLRWGHLGDWKSYNPRVREDCHRVRNRPTEKNDKLFPPHEE